MSGVDESLPPSGLLTDGNAQELVIGPRRNPSGNRRDHGAPRPPPRGDPGSASQPLDVEPLADPVSQGFDKIMARFDKLEFHLESTDRRVENLEAPASPDPDPPYYSDEAADDVYRGRQDLMGFESDGIPRNFNHVPRDRGGDGCPFHRDSRNPRGRIGRST